MQNLRNFAPRRSFRYTVFAALTVGIQTLLLTVVVLLCENAAPEFCAANQ